MEELQTAKSNAAGETLEEMVVPDGIVQVNLDETVPELASSDKSIQIDNGRKVKRYIHCSDGVYEEFSSDEEGVCKVPASSTLVDPKTMTWIPWFSHVSSKALAACDYVGETLADFLGITAPKYQYEIEEARRMQEEEKAEKKAVDLEMAGWRDQSTTGPEPQTSTPISILPKVIPNRSSTGTDN
ncbi:protein FAM177B-like isoform X1 [Daphnia magna]|uniref:protein FAM177B-like isoform X1 n=2 Tax=Daphnia magna TaxID=35525 RepID=UPI0006E0D9CB|nr:protein FAM177B-like isoform X1 [Daphnia magna]